MKEGELDRPLEWRNLTECKRLGEPPPCCVLLTNHVRDIVLLVHRENGRILEANDSAVRAYGYSRDELLALRIRDLRGPNGHFLTDFQMAEADASGVLFEAEHLRKDGTTFPVEVSSQGITVEGVRVLLSVIRDITTRKRAEEALRESEANFRALAENSTTAIFIVQGEKFVYMNTSFRESSGYTLEDLEAVPFWELLGPELRDEVRANAGVRQRQSDRTPKHYEVKALSKSGAERVMDATVSGVQFNKRPAILGVATDITDRKRMEDALRASEALFHAVVDKSRDGIVMQDKDGRVTYVSPSFTRISGYTLEDLAGRFGPDYTHPDDRAVTAGKSRELLQTPGASFSAEYRIRHKLGHWLWVETTGTNLLHDPNVQAVVYNIRDITKRKQAEEALRESDKRMSRAQEIAHLGSWELDLLTNRLSWSDEVYRIFGLQPQAFGATYEAFLEAVHPEDRKLVDAAYSGSLREGRDIYEVEHRIVRKSNGEVRTVHEKCEHFRDVSGRIVRSVGMVHDITERQSAEKALQTARDELEKRVEERTQELRQAYEELVKETKEKERLEERLRQAQKIEAVGTLAGGIAHDFNNMLAVIIGNAELALDDVREDAVRHNLEQIFRASKRGRDLVRQILTFSRKSDKQRKSVGLAPLVKETLRLLRSSIPTSIEMSLDVRTDGVAAFAEPSEIQQIIMNLASNAEHAMRDNGGTLTLSVDEKVYLPGDRLPEADMEPGDYVMITVRDTGVGMKAAIMKRIFDPFFTTKEIGEGTGLGLAVVYGITRDLGGGITVSSKPGKGTTFQVLLPKAGLDREDRHEMPDSLQGGKERILFIDDEEAVTEASRAILERLGYRVTATTDSEKALDLFAEDPMRYDLVITDQAMPHITGMGLAEKMLKVRGDIPIILCTGYSHTASPERAKMAGIKSFLMKPIVKRELGETIRRVLDSQTPGSDRK